MTKEETDQFAKALEGFTKPAWAKLNPDALQLNYSNQPWQSEKQENAELEAAKVAAITSIDEAISRTQDPDTRQKLEELKERIRGASRLSELNTINSLASSISSASPANGAGDPASASRAEINAAHDRLYERDPEYRATTDRLNAASDERIRNGDALARESQELADRLGIRTDALDEEIRNAERALRNASPMERELAEKRLHDLHESRERERARQARDTGHQEAGNQFDGNANRRNVLSREALEAYRERTRAFLEAKTRELSQNGSLTVEGQRELENYRRAFQENIRAAERAGGDARLDEIGNSIVGATRRFNARATNQPRTMMPTNSTADSTTPPQTARVLLVDDEPEDQPNRPDTRTAVASQPPARQPDGAASPQPQQTRIILVNVDDAELPAPIGRNVNPSANNPTTGSPSRA